MGLNSNKVKIVIVTITLLATFTGIFYRIYTKTKVKNQFVKMYPKVEQLIGIYSLLCWRSAEQQPPQITEDSEWGGAEFQLNCNNIKWGTGGIVRSGELFSCFAEEIPKTIDGVESLMPRITTNEDYWYKFPWEGLFGYEMNVEISPPLTEYKYLYVLRDSIVKEQKKLADEDHPEQSDFGSFNTYAVKLSGLSNSDSVCFIAANGYITMMSNGSPDRHEEWVVYINGTTPMTLGAINKFIQLTMRKLLFTDTDLSRVVPQLEAKWMNSDSEFTSSIFAELENAPDLMGISEFLKPGP